MPCRTGCKSKDHRSYAECLRSTRVQVGATDTRGPSTMKELSAYADARRQGIQPASTRMADTQAAVEVSQSVGRAFDAATGSFKS